MNLFDTHCHLNFEAFEGRVEEVINSAKKAGVNNIIAPGTDVLTSQKAVEIAEKYPGIYAAVGIHPHHAIQYLSHCHLEPLIVISNGDIRDKLRERSSDRRERNASLDFSVTSFLRNDIETIETLLKNPKVVAIGEVGIDKHYYQKTKHKGYKVNEEFIDLQKEFFIKQIKLAHKYKKSLIIHNREAKNDVLKILTDYRLLITDYSSVFHCCEPDEELLEFAKKNKIFIGVDGDVTYWKEKQKFIRKVPLEMLVLETDSPFLMPRLLSMRRPSTRYNEPKNIVLIAEFIAKLKGVSINQLIDTTTENARKLFKI